MGKRLRHLHGHLSVGRLLALGCVAALAVVGVASAAAGKEGQHPEGAVYTESNSPAGNSVAVFDRFHDGTLSLRQTVSTGANGSTQAVGCGPGCPILDSQNEVVVSDDGKLVFAVNAGSDSVSSFRETKHDGLVLVGHWSSGGDMPESLALSDHTLYVLNVATENANGTTGNVYGYHVSNHGHLTPLGSSQPLAHAAPPDHSADPRALGFDHDGRVLVATEIAAGFNDPTYGPPGAIDTFVIGPHGEAGPAVSHHTSDAFPFGFAVDNHDQLVLSQIHTPDGLSMGTVSTYQISNSGGVTPIDTKPSGGFLPCWVAVKNDGKLAYVVNTGPAPNPAPVNGFGIGNHGALTPLSPPAGSTPGEFARTDEALSKDGKYLYVLAPSVGPGAPSHIDEYSVNKDGSLTFIGATPAGANIGIGASGVAAR
jgi:6-phosphogluconolactonase (cycloisomerase 2 family)